MRLNRFLASAGLGSRRSVEDLVRIGQVRINGHVVTDLATQVVSTDAVKVGNRLLHQEKMLYAVLHKPAGYVCTADDDLGRKTIFDLLPETWPRTHYVGRLDLESEGLLLVTNDGDLTNVLTHPRHEVEKEYELILDKAFEPAKRAKLLKGFRIEPGFAKCERVETLRPNHIRVILRQGLKRQLRLMLYAIGYEVERLVRVRLGPIRIDDLPKGGWRFLTAKEITTLRQTQPPAKAATTATGKPAWKPATKSAKRPAWKPKRLPKAAETAGTSTHSVESFDEMTESRPTAKPARKPSAAAPRKPGTRSTAKPDAQTSRRPDAKPTGRPFSKGGPKPTGRSFSKPGAASRPDSQSDVRPSARPTGPLPRRVYPTSEGKTAGAKPRRDDAKPFGKPGAKTFNKRFDNPKPKPRRTPSAGKR